MPTVACKVFGLLMGQLARRMRCIDFFRKLPGGRTATGRLRARLFAMKRHPLLRSMAAKASGLAVAAILILSPLAALLAYGWSVQSGYDELGARARPQLDLYAAGLASELRRHEYVPGLVELEPQALSLLAAHATRGDSRAARDKTSEAFARLATKTGTQAIFLLDPSGLCIASSNWYLPESLVGRDLSAMPLYAQAMQAGHAGAFASNGSSDTGGADYYFAQLIRDQGQVLGVAVARVSLEKLETTWVEDAARPQSDKLLVIDENDVIIMSSVPGWKYRAITVFSLERRERLRALGRYPDQVGVFQPINATLDQVLGNGAAVMRLPFHGVASPLVRYTAHERQGVGPGWRLILFSDASAVRVNALKTATVAAGVIVLIGFLGLYLIQYRRQAASRHAAREMLQQAHDELGRRVEERTAELRQINKELVREIGERENAEAVLRTAQAELVQAGKMALLGQLATGITHEINQPLMALRALSDNARLLLERGRMDETRANLKSIADLTERMGRITSQLKSFARKAPAQAEPVPVGRCVANALSLLGSRIRAARVDVQTDIPAAMRAECDANRLEQVLLNLVANALDALQEAPGERQVRVRAWYAGDDRDGPDGQNGPGRVMLQVNDTGSGIPDEVARRLFEPFFSTKPSGQGLGLGLVISANIVREFGGTLRAVPAPRGAAFEFDLKPSPEAQDV